MKRGTSLMCSLMTALNLGIASDLVRAEQPITDPTPALQQAIDLQGPRSEGTRYFDMQTTWTDIAADGTRGAGEVYRVRLMCTTRDEADGGGVHYTCGRFDYIKADGTSVDIPALAGWSYTRVASDDGLDEKGQVFGIDHGQFENLVDSQGSPLGPEKSYIIYNTFIDFHGIVDVFAKPVAGGGGIQDLTRLGQQIVHAAADSTPPTNLGSNIKEGSYFKNGHVTLTLKGLTLVEGAPCALVGYDSGDSSFRMLMEPMPGMNIESVGGSHYFGDIYVDLRSKWPSQADMGEFVVTRTRVPMPNAEAPTTINSVMERRTVLKSVTRQAYEID